MAHTGDEVALPVTYATEGAGAGNVNKAVRHGYEVFRERIVEVHSSLRIVGYIMLLLAGGAQSRPQKVDFTHCIMTTLSRNLFRFFRNHNHHLFDMESGTLSGKISHRDAVRQSPKCHCYKTRLC